MTLETPTPKRGPGRPRKPADLKLRKITGYLLPAELLQLRAVSQETGLSPAAILRTALTHLLAARSLGK